jgi:hypothetical protein
MSLIKIMEQDEDGYYQCFLEQSAPIIVFDIEIKRLQHGEMNS